MFASMFKLLNTSEKKTRIAMYAIEFEIVEITRKDIRELLTKINKVNKNEVNGENCPVSKNNIIDAIKILQDIQSHLLFLLPSSVIDYEDFPKYLSDGASVEHLDNTKSEVNSIGKYQLLFAEVKDPNNKRILNQLKNLQCLFTWNFKPNKKKNTILWIWNKYGEYNLNITSSEFTLERFIGNLIISYEFFHNGESELAQFKILEIGKWLEELDKGTDEFYLSINTGLLHIIKASLIYLLFATNLIEECKWLLKDISVFSRMDFKSRASVYAIHAAVLIEYGENLVYLSKACDMAKKACDLDPKTSHWFYIHSLTLTALRQFSVSHTSMPADDELNAIHQAVLLSNGKNQLFNYHALVMDYNTIVANYHNNKNNNDICTIKNNIPENQNIVDMIKIILNTEPKDPLLVVQCAKTLMTLPPMVQDFNLGIQYLKKAFQMSRNDVAVFKAIGKAIEAYYYEEIGKKLGPDPTETLQLETELLLIVEKQKNGEDPVPYLTDLVSKYDGLNQLKIISQLCSYTLLYTNNLRFGIELYDKLLEHPETVNNDIFIQHISIFGLKKFNLSELICNEIRLASNASGNSSDDMLYYYKILSKIIKIYNFYIKDVDSSMKANIILN